MEIPKALWREVFDAIKDEEMRHLCAIPGVKLNGYRKGRAPRHAMITQLLQPSNLRYVRFGLNEIGRKDYFEVDYHNLSVEEIIESIAQQDVYDTPMIVLHMLSSDDEIVRIKGVDLWERHKAQSAEQTEPDQTADRSDATEAKPAEPSEVQEDAGKLRRLEKKLQDLKESREKDRREWEQQRSKMQKEIDRLSAEVKQAKAGLQRAEQEKLTLIVERDNAKREAEEKQNKIANQARKILELESTLRQWQERQGAGERPTAPPQEETAAPVQRKEQVAAPPAERIPIVIVSDAEWVGRLRSTTYDLSYVTPMNLEREINAGLLDRVQQVWMPRNDLRMTDQRLVRKLIPKERLKDMRDIIELKKQL